MRHGRCLNVGMSVRQIAQLAGISHAAVSLALHDSPKISAATRRRVLKIARQLGYRPNAKVGELMRHVSMSRNPSLHACFGVISLYDSARPWEHSVHLQRLYDGMTARAEALGYRLEPLWLRAPDMTYRRARGILDARGIEGLLCFGSPDFDAKFPVELKSYAIVTQGLSIATPLHRVISHGYNDTWQALERAHRLGYRRPGLVLGRYEEVRSGHANASAYLGWCEHVMGRTPAIPILRFDKVERERLGGWLREHEPDVVIFVHNYALIAEFGAALQQLKIKVPDQLPVIVVSQVVRGSGFAGMEENQRLMGAWAVELLVGRIVNRDFGIPTQARIEPVESQWVEGDSLPTRRK